MSHRVDLTNYPKFFVTFREYALAKDWLSISPSTVERILWEQFGLTSKVLPNDRLWYVFFDDVNYTAFLLKYS